MSAFIRQILSLIRPYTTRMILGVVCGLLSGLSGLILVLTVQLVIGVIFPGTADQAAAGQLQAAPEILRAPVGWLAKMLPAERISSDRLLVVLVITLVPIVMFLRSLVAYLNVYFLEWVSIRAITDLRTRLFNHLVSMPLDFLHRSSTGDLMSRITQDTASMQRAISYCVPIVVKDPVTVISLACLLLSKQGTLTLIALVLLPAAVIPISIYSRKVRKGARGIQNTYAELSTLMQEVFTSSRVIKAYNLEPEVVGQFSAASKRFVNIYMRVSRSAEIPGPLIEFFASLGVGGILYYLALAPHKPIELKDLAGFLASLFLLYQPIKNIVRVQSYLQQSRAASERVFELLALQSTVPEPARPQPLDAANATIRFEGVNFSYGDKPVLHDINLEIKPGQLLALVGKSGSGKTTLANLLLRFYDPQRGVVRVGPTDIRDVTISDLRRQIALVTQETILFNESIRQNIALGRPGATDAEIEAAARHAYAHDFILEKPGGYSAPAGEKGANLSMGQRQRITIARAIVRDAPILVLDEATSSLDTESERIVQAALDDLMKGRTTICIAHRLSTIQNADIIVVLEQGRIVETGTHAELLQRSNGAYRRLHES